MNGCCSNVPLASPPAGREFGLRPNERSAAQRGWADDAGRGALPHRCAIPTPSPHPRPLRRLAASGSPPSASGARRMPLASRERGPGYGGVQARTSSRRGNFRRRVDFAGARSSMSGGGRSGLPIRGERAMRVMVLVKATKDSEAGVMPSTELLEAMGKFNEELVKAGIMLAGEGLQPSLEGQARRPSTARAAPSSTGRSPRPRSSSPASGSGRSSRWTRRSRG